MDELQAGDPQQVGGYTLLARLGAGGMGQVYLGRSPGGRPVAVKVIRADLAKDPGFRLRFAREVQAARRVSGAFTAPVIDADPDAPVPWLVTDYVHGPSLADAVADHGPLPLSCVLTLAARLAEGLGAVHAAGVIHRDLKPGNVLLVEDGPRLIDFGISQAADFVQITSATSVMGTPGFIAPELITSNRVEPSGDIFTMGAVLAYAATGELPFGFGPSEARTLRVLYLAPDLDHVPAELRPLLERCLDKDPARRPTARQFLADLVAAHPDAPGRDDWLPEAILAEIRRPRQQRELATSRLRVTAPAPGPAPAGRTGGKRWTSRRPRVWIASALVAATGLLAGIGLAAVPSAAPQVSQAAAPSATTPVSQAVVPSATPHATLVSRAVNPQVAGAAFNWSGHVEVKETASSDNLWQNPGSTWQDRWVVKSQCGARACAATLNGSLNGNDFTAKLSRSGATYSGIAAIDDYWPDCQDTSEYENSTLVIQLTATSAAEEGGQRDITAFNGTISWDVSLFPDYCGSSLYQMQVTSTSS